MPPTHPVRVTPRRLPILLLACVLLPPAASASATPRVEHLEAEERRVHARVLVAEGTAEEHGGTFFANATWDGRTVLEERVRKHDPPTVVSPRKASAHEPSADASGVPAFRVTPDMLGLDAAGARGNASLARLGAAGAAPRDATPTMESGAGTAQAHADAPARVVVAEHEPAALGLLVASPPPRAPDDPPAAARPPRLPPPAPRPDAPAPGPEATPASEPAREPWLPNAVLSAGLGVVLAVLVALRLGPEDLRERPVVRALREAAARRPEGATAAELAQWARASCEEARHLTRREAEWYLFHLTRRKELRRHKVDGRRIYTPYHAPASRAPEPLEARLLRAVRERPGLTAAEAARALGVTPTRLDRALKPLLMDGKLRRMRAERGRGMGLVAAGA